MNHMKNPCSKIKFQAVNYARYGLRKIVHTSEQQHNTETTSIGSVDGKSTTSVMNTNESVKIHFTM